MKGRYTIMKKLFEIECQRHNVTPKQFYEYCRKQSAKKGLDIECFTTYESISTLPVAKLIKVLNLSHLPILAYYSIKNARGNSL